MKELKPKLILADSRRGENRGNLKLLMVFVLGFALGIYSGMKLKDADTDKIKPAGKKEETRYSDRPSEIRSDKVYSEENSEIENGPVSKRQRTDPGQDDLTISVASKSTVPLESKPINPATEHLAESESQQAKKLDKNKLETGKRGYTLQIAAFKTMERAEIGANELKSKGYKGYDVYIIPTLNSKEESWNLLRMGKFKTEEEAENFASTLQQKEGIKAMVKELD
ncbi:MAG TPA: SPOR domain-containing protein [Thermodesulfobacteriota bacterium]|nr:SPOR domain-containing protein [Thermodesulfobacteriota bacterium]